MFLSKVKHKNLIPGAIALSVFLLSGCGEETASQVAAAAVPVDVAIVSTMDVPVTSRLTGRADPVRKAEVRPQVSGIILKRLFTEGSIVEEGQQLYQIDPALYEAAVDSAKAQLESAKATLTSTSLRYERYKKLLKSNAISKQDYDDTEAAYLQAKAGVNSAKAQLKTAEINLAYTKVYAPISGRIGKSDFTEGALVSAQQTNPLATIQQLDPMYVDFGQSVEQHLALRRAVLVRGAVVVDHEHARFGVLLLGRFRAAVRAERGLRQNKRGGESNAYRHFQGYTRLCGAPAGEHLRYERRGCPVYHHGRCGCSLTQASYGSKQVRPAYRPCLFAAIPTNRQTERLNKTYERRHDLSESPAGADGGPFLPRRHQAR